jgi:hypothetical protein
MTGMLCWACGMEPVRSVDFEGDERIVRFRHKCPVLAVAKQRVLEARRAASARAERMATMEQLLRRIETEWSNICPACDRRRAAGHDPDCSFARLLAELDAADRPEHSENPWDVLLIDGKPAPAHCRLRFEPVGLNQGKGMALGHRPVRFEIELLVLPENVEACENFVRKFWPYKPGEMASLVSYEVVHAALALLGVRRIAIIGVRSGEGPEPGTRCFVLKALEYAPKRTATEPGK